MVIYADRCDIPGWGDFWTGILDHQVAFLSLSTDELPLGSSMSKSEPSAALRRFAKKWGLSLKLGAVDPTEQLWDQLEQYLAGTRKEFDLPLRLLGTEFQVKIWQALLTIPWGVVYTYGDLAMSLGNRGLARAVGQANSRNPISIVVPCHRVIAADGLGGYAGGLDLKQRLLQLEGSL